MDVPIVNEEIKKMPSVNSEDMKPNKSRTKIFLLVFVSLAILSLAGLGYLYLKNGSDFLNIFEKETEEEYTETESEKDENTIKPDEIMIAGTLGYPSEQIPSMKVCAVNTVDKKETCIQTSEGATNYTLTVKSGSYLIYSSVENQKAYYTECDTYTDSQVDPRCNSNFNDSNGEWYNEGFLCYEDTNCKKAFTPLVVTTTDQTSMTLETILQGWYIPCNDSTVCSDPTFDVWSNYIK